MSEYYRVNAPTVVHEIMDGEVVIINMDNGSYFSIGTVGAEIWILLDGGHAVNQIVTQVAERYDHSSDQVEPDITSFLAHLSTEELVVATPMGTETAIDLGAKRGKYSKPALEKYTDMEELLLLDPIHEVTDSGWPAAS